MNPTCVFASVYRFQHKRKQIWPWVSM